MEVYYNKEVYGEYSVDVFSLYQFGEQMYHISYRHCQGFSDFVTYINEVNRKLLDYFVEYSLNDALLFVAKKINYSYEKLKEMFMRDYNNLLSGIYH